MKCILSTRLLIDTRQDDEAVPHHLRSLGQLLSSAPKHQFQFFSQLLPNLLVSATRAHWPFV